MFSPHNLIIYFLTFSSQLINDSFIEQSIITKLNRLGNKTTYKKNSLIFMQGTRGKFLHILESGQVKIVLEGKRQQTIAIKKDKSIFGCVVLFSYNPEYPASAYTKEISIINRIEKSQAENFIKNDPNLYNLWMHFIVKKTSNFAKTILNINLNDAVGKVCYFILEHIKSHHYQRECDGYVIEMINQTTISDLTGLRRETIARVFKRLIRMGVLEICNKKIIVKDLDKLALFLSSFTTFSDL